MNEPRMQQTEFDKALLSSAGILKAVERLRTFCSAVERLAESETLREAATEQLRQLREVDAAVDHVFLHERRDPRTDLAPDAEILRRPSGDVSDFSDRPVFIIGNRRSGTTLVSHLINAGSDIAALPECYVATALTTSDALIQRGVSARRQLGEPFPRYLRRFGQFADGVYLDYARRNGKQRWASKELSAWQKLDRLDAMFDYRARFVYVVRHGLDVAWSCASRFPMRDGMPQSERTGLTLAVFVDEWIANNEATLDFVERNQERSCLVRYEELTREPESSAQRLFRFLEQPWDAKVFERMQKQELSGAGDNKIFRTAGKISSRPASVWHDWPSPLVKQLGRRANSTLVRLGYEPIT
jgi:protein-tyrosine sulfotransferase